MKHICYIQCVCESYLVTARVQTITMKQQPTITHPHPPSGGNTSTLCCFLASMASADPLSRFAVLVPLQVWTCEAMVRGCLWSNKASRCSEQWICCAAVSLTQEEWGVWSPSAGIQVNSGELSCRWSPFQTRNPHFSVELLRWTLESCSPCSATFCLIVNKSPGEPQTLTRWGQTPLTGVRPRPLGDTTGSPRDFFHFFSCFNLMLVPGSLQVWTWSYTWGLGCRNEWAGFTGQSVLGAETKKQSETQQHQDQQGQTGPVKI